jgi:hypothetical protein
MTASFDYVQFINEGFDAQQKYSKKADEWGPRDYQNLDSLGDEASQAFLLDNDIFSPLGKETMLKKRYEKIIEMFGHLAEEAIEARVFIPRRSWKNGERSYLDNAELRKEFVAEMYDVILFHRAILAYAGVTGEEFARIAAEKQAYNQIRPDHAINGNAPVADSPSAELQGFCPSASFSVV